MALPLEKRKIVVDTQNGINKEVPAIHEIWKDTRDWSKYSPPPPQQEMELTGAIDAWLDSTSRVAADLSFLLRLPAHKFWSQIIFDQRLQIILEGMLQNYPRAYDQPKSKHLLDANLSVLHKLFLVYLRLSTYKESQADFFTAEYYANMIYDKFIMDVPKLLDICSLFPDCNKEITKKMVANIFKVQPKYSDDLFNVGETLAKGFETVTEQLQVVRMSDTKASAAVEEVVDILGFVLDIASSVDCLLDIYPPAVHALHPTGFEVKLGSFYQSSMIELSQLLDKNLKAKLLTQQEYIQYTRLLQLARHRTITGFRQMVNVSCLNMMMGPEDNQECLPGHELNCDISSALEDFLAIFTNILQERTFLLDYNSKYPISDDFELFEQAGCSVDPTRRYYILDALCSDTKQESNFNTLMSDRSNESSHESSPSVGAMAADPSSSTSNNQVSTGGQTEIQMESMISSVQDLLPHLGSGYVEACLQHYNFKVEEVVNAILEGNLAPHLISLDQGLQRQPRKESSPQLPVEVPGRGVYDDDEFDVNSRDTIDLSKVHRGKKNKVGNMKSLMDNKEELHSMKERFSRLGIVEDIVTVRGEDAEYNDEYDDTYDDIDVGQWEPEEEADGRKFVLPVALGGGKVDGGRGGQHDVDDEEDSEDSDHQSNYAKSGQKPMNFARNPEEIRQEQERRRQEKMARRNKKGGNGGGAGGGGGQQPPQQQPGNRFDVVGKAKGQGQDKQVLLNRARKNANKGKGHRVGADKKMSKGMY